MSSLDHANALVQMHAGHEHPFSLSRRAAIGSGVIGSVFSLTPPAAHARGAVHFPPKEPLTNRYWLLRSGESVQDLQGLVSTNPVDKLSFKLTPRGRLEAEKAAETLRALGADNPHIWFSTYNDASETAHIIGDKLHVGHDRRMPEYTYLDARGLGLFQGTAKEFAAAEIAKIDARDPSERPPETVDGTPNESVQDVAVRVQQMVSIIETLTTSEDVLIVAPDSQVLSIWQAAIAGAPLGGHTAFSLAPGQVVMLEYQMRHANGDPSTRAETFVVPGSDGNGLKRKLALATAIANEGEKQAGAMASQLEAERAGLVAKLTHDRSELEAARQTTDASEQASLLAERRARQASDRQQRSQLGSAAPASWRTSDAQQGRHAAASGALRSDVKRRELEAGEEAQDQRRHRQQLREEPSTGTLTSQQQRQQQRRREQRQLQALASTATSAPQRGAQPSGISAFIREYPVGAVLAVGGLMQLGAMAATSSNHRAKQHELDRREREERSRVTQELAAATEAMTAKAREREPFHSTVDSTEVTVRATATPFSKFLDGLEDGEGSVEEQAAVGDTNMIENMIETQLITTLEKAASARKGDDMARAVAAIEAEAAKAAERQYMPLDDVVEQFVVSMPGNTNEEEGAWDEDAEFDEWASSMAQLQKEAQHEATTGP